MSIKKIICYIVFILILLYLPDIVFFTGDHVNFVSAAYLIYYGAKVLFVGIGLIMLFRETIKHVE